MSMKWIPAYNTGIDVIDDQHKRILEYINGLDNLELERAKVQEILDHIIDYTQSHFTFEESLQEEAGYKYRIPHKRVHDLFIKKIESYRHRFETGQAIEAELHEVLAKWLINHIQHDDADYVGAVKENMLGIIQDKERKKGKNWFARFFSSSVERI
ncbi:MULTISPECIES: bacteriohemerythrin [unclassified Acinetobacter]|uniref:bacteriohemerythrin n=1 Tax=unclassified Acinetobacter TaxID=196816 RepID=UPI00293436DE|nr:MULTISPECIES: bacteriohemerythrin [unclassified Acinetobacter]WOE32985.1 bacteriohemerythrin [Acinetobacter sp. SAAs470]WOE38463.1 bacteriohemerythrin [Acinetobacter sp. SAAs474]